jgi:hypothetical protein
VLFTESPDCPADAPERCADATDHAAKLADYRPTGAAAEKAAARDALEDVLFLICEALAVLAHTSKDRDLLALTDLTLTDLDRFGGEELSHRATTVLERANASKTALAPFQITQANIDELAQTLETFQATKEKPRMVTAERAVQTEAVATLIREASGILREQIDRLVNLFRRSNPEFVAGYRAARVIVDRKASHTTTKAAESAPQPNP